MIVRETQHGLHFWYDRGSLAATMATKGHNRHALEREIRLAAHIIIDLCRVKPCSCMSETKCGQLLQAVGGAAVSFNVMYRDWGSDRAQMV